MIHLSAFDLDRTLFRGNSSFHFCWHLIRHKKLPWYSLVYSLLCYLLHRLGRLSLKELHERIFCRFLLGYSLDILNDEVKIFISHLTEKVFYLPAWQHLKEAKARGHYTVLLSNSPSFLVGPLATFLGFNDFRASEYAVDKEGKLCDISSVLEGADKAVYLKQLAKKQGIKKEHTIAYSDSYLDLPFLQAAGMAVAINPDKRLQRVSRKEKWLVR